jgi:hypothetical protein
MLIKPQHYEESVKFFNTMVRTTQRVRRFFICKALKIERGEEEGTSDILFLVMNTIEHKN